MRKQVVLPLIFIFVIGSLFIFAHSSIAQDQSDRLNPTPAPGRIGGICIRDSQEFSEAVSRSNFLCDVPAVGDQLCDLAANIVKSFQSAIPAMGYQNLPALMCNEGRPSIVGLDGKVEDGIDIQNAPCYCYDPFATSIKTSLVQMCTMLVLNLNQSDIDLMAEQLANPNRNYSPQSALDIRNPEVKGLVQIMLAINSVGSAFSDDTRISLALVNKVIKDIGHTYQLTQPTVKQYEQCLRCAYKEEYYSGISCLPVNNISTFIQRGVFNVGMGIAGAIALGFLVFGAIQLQLSQGDSKKIQAAKDMMRNAIIGLLVIIFSIFLIRFIAATILKINVF